MKLTIALIVANVVVYATGVSTMSMLANMFVHTNLVHLVGNMVFLAAAGAIVERELSSIRFLAIYLAAGVAGCLLHTLVSGDELVGASGAVCGVLAVAAVLRPRVLVFVAALLGLNIWYALSGAGGDVSFGSHIGGFAVGAVVGLRMRRNLEVAP
jgi:membrane associated rhomboid family serine protease